MATEYDVIPALHSDTERIANALEILASRQNKGYVLYGFHIDTTESDSEACVTYLEDAVNAMPAGMDFTHGVFDYGTWKNAFFMPKPCMLKNNGLVDYYLNENDYTKKEDGSASDVANSAYDGNAMMEFPKIWMKVVPDTVETGVSVYFADKQVDGTFTDYPYINKNGKHVDKIYLPIYNGSVDTNNKLRSLSGVTNIANAVNTTTQITQAEANGDGWYIDDFGTRMMINFLHVLISKNFNSQSAFGNGLMSGNETSANAYVTGTLDKSGLFFGYNDGTNGVKTFGMENWWGCFWRRTAGMILKNGTPRYKMCWGQEDGSTVDEYNQTGDGYIEFPYALAAENTYVSTWSADKNTMLPKAGGGSSSTYSGDYFYVNNSITAFALFGGNSNAGSACGAWCVNLSNPAGYAPWACGASPSFK